MFESVIISPHFDDAVFSAWHLINQPNSSVITVYAGVPSSGSTTFWDKLCGEPDSNKMLIKRRAENESLLGALTTTINLEYLDNQYKHDSYDIAAIANDISSQYSSKVHFYAPLAGSLIWRHKDHVTLRQVGIQLMNQGRVVSFYADIPYMQMPLVGGKLSENRLTHRAAKLLGIDVRIEIHELAKNDQQSKRIAMKKYNSQYQMTNLLALGTLKRQVNTRRELLFHPTQNSNI